MEWHAYTPGTLRETYPEMTHELDTNLIQMEAEVELRIQHKVLKADNDARIHFKMKDGYSLVLSPSVTDQNGNKRWFKYTFQVRKSTGERRRSHVINGYFDLYKHVNGKPGLIASFELTEANLTTLMMNAFGYLTIHHNISLRPIHS